MNVALVIDRLGVPGGAERAVETLAVGLARRGWRVFCYCLRSAAQIDPALAASGVVVREAHSEGFDPLLRLRLGRWLKQDGIQLVHAHSSAALVSIVRACRRRGMPLVQTRHGALAGPPSRHRRRADRVADQVDAIAIVARALQAGLPARVPSRRVTWIPNGIDCEVVSPRVARAELARLCGQRVDGPFVLSVGTICVEKDTRGLLRAFQRLLNSVSDARLICVGAQRDTAYAEAARKDAAALGIAARVHWVGPQPQPWRLMAGADVFCLASAREAAPIALLEAMSQRTPIVATAVGDVGRLDGAGKDEAMLVHGATALLVPPGDPEALGAALREALEGRPAARARAERAFGDYRRRFTAAYMVEDYQRLYERVLARRRSCALMVGPAPPEVGGMVTVIDNLLSSRLAARFRLSLFPTPAPQPARRSAWIGARLARQVSAARRHLEQMWLLARQIERRRASLVHIHTCSYFSFFRSGADAWLGRLLGRKVMLHIHGGGFERFCRAAGPLRRLLIRGAAGGAHAVIVLSQAERVRLAPFLGKQPIVVSNGVPIRRRAPGPTEAQGFGLLARTARRGCRFLFLGALRESKGVFDLLEAAARIRDTAAFEALLVGPVGHRTRERILRRITTLGLGSHVFIRSPVDGLARDAILAECDCLVLPSHREAMPMVVLEAAAAGLAVIATRVGAIEEMLTPVADDAPDTSLTDHGPQARSAGADSPAPSSTGLTQAAPRSANRLLAPVIPPRDPAALGEAMARLATDAELRTETGRRLREHVKRNYSLRAQAQTIGDLYEKLLG